MKSSTLTASYLWKDTCSRWLEQPGSPMARCFVTALLVAVALVILVSLHLLERSVRERLDHFGLNTLLVRETIMATDSEFIVNSQRADRLSFLAEYGSMLRLRQIFMRGQTEWQNELAVFSYSKIIPPTLAGLFSPNTSLICLSKTLPENVLVRVTVNRRSDVAIVRRPDEMLRPMVTENMLLVPQGWLVDEERVGHVDTLVFQRREDALPMAKIVEAAQTVFSLDRRTPQFQSALSLIEAWETLKERQRLWRTWLAGVLGLALALVFGTIAVLEFRQNLFVTALLRSFGVPASWLWWRQWLENALLANLAALLVVGFLFFFHSTIFATLGFPRTVIQLTGDNPYFGGEVGMILVWVNMGAFLSSLPVAIGLRRPVGKTLS